MKNKILAKGISLGLIIVLCLSSAFPAFAESGGLNNNPVFILSSEYALIGDTFQVNLDVNNNPGITALQLSVEFDESVISLIDIEHKELFSNISTCSNKNNSPFKISWYSQQSKDEDANGTLAVLTFRVNEEIQPTDTFITLSYDEDNVFNSKFENISFSTVDSQVAVVEYIYGDVNSDKAVNMKDIAMLQQYLNGYEVQSDNNAADVYKDGKLNMKDIALLQQYLNGYDVILGEERTAAQKPTGEQGYSSFTYGKSELGRDLICHSFTPQNYDSTVLLNFAIHGFEDEYDADGQVLVDTANVLIDYYKENADKLCNTRLLIVPCANPDGLYEGNTNNGFGRCNANGVDLNRDFDANYTSFSSTRNYTPYAFSASESRALRDLVNDYSADVVVDFHGWLNETIGDYEIGSIFAEEMDLQHYVSYSDTNGNGYFSNWAHQQGALGLLVEFKNSQTVPIDKLEKSVNRILSKDYPIQTVDERFSEFDKIDCYTLSTERVTTYRFTDVPYNTTSYIDGATDKVTILGIYDNGWVKTQYPITSGNKIGYCKLTEFISEDEFVKPYTVELNENTVVYKRSDLTETFGTVFPTDAVYVVAEKEDLLQIIYPLDNGGYKMGWILGN